MRAQLADHERSVEQYKKMIANAEEFEAKLRRSLLAVRALAAEQGAT